MMNEPPQPQLATSMPVERPLPDRLQAEARTWAMLCHLSSISGFIGVPFGHIVGPLVVWLVKKDQFPLVDDQGKESLNFQISMTIYGIVALFLCFVLIGIPLLVLLVFVDLVLSVIASIEASHGQLYRYPFSIRFLT
jgi:uncharacterized Tic20 family protein